MQPLRNCNGPTIRIGQEILCLPYTGFLGMKTVCISYFSVIYFCGSNWMLVILFIIMFEKVWIIMKYLV